MVTIVRYAIAVMALVIFMTGCISPEPPKETALSEKHHVDDGWELVSPDRAISMDVSEAHIVGRLPDTDLKAILRQVGRVVGIEPSVVEIVAYGDGLFLPAVRVTMAETFTVYLVVNSGEWCVANVVRRYP